MSHLKGFYSNAEIFRNFPSPMPHNVIGNVDFVRDKDNVYKTPDNLVHLSFITKGIEIKRIRITYEDSARIYKEVTAEITTYLPNPRIKEQEKDDRPERVSNYLKRVGYIVKMEVVPYKDPHLRVKHPFRNVIKRDKGEASFVPVDQQIMTIKRLLKELGYKRMSKETNESNYKKMAVILLNLIKKDITRTNPLTRVQKKDPLREKLYEGTYNLFKKCGLI